VKRRALAAPLNCSMTAGSGSDTESDEKGDTDLVGFSLSDFDGLVDAQLSPCGLSTKASVGDAHPAVEEEEGGEEGEGESGLGEGSFGDDSDTGSGDEEGYTDLAGFSLSGLDGLADAQASPCGLPTWAFVG